jgi:hypothetical protein
VTTIDQSIIKRRRWGAIAAAVFFFGVGLVAAALFFAIFVAFPGIPSVTWKALLIVCGAVCLFAFGGGWLARGFIVENVDTLVRDWGPMTRRLFASRIAEEDGETLTVPVGKLR